MGYNIKQNADGSTALVNEADSVEVLKLDRSSNIDLTGATSVDIGAGKLEIAGTAVTASAAELNYVDVTTAGTAQASKAVVLDSSKDITGIRNITLATAGKIASTADHLYLNSGVTSTDLAGKTVRINSITNTGTANDPIGFQSKIAQGATTTKNVIGGEISPRLNNTFGAASVIGLHVDAYLKGTAAGAISGDVRGLQVELVTDDAGVRAISGNVSALRIRAAFSAAVTGEFTPFRVEKAEAQTGSKNWDELFDLTGQSPDCWSDDPTTELNNPGGTVKGYIKVRVNAADRYIALYEKGNLAD